MPDYVKKADCSYCGAANVLNLRKASNGLILCDACGAKLSVDDFKPAVQTPASTPQRTPHRSEKPQNEKGGGLMDLAQRALDKLDDLDDDWDDRWKKNRKKKKGLFSRIADIADDIFD